MIDCILNELWESRHDKDILFLSIIEGYRIMKNNDDIYYMKDNDILIQYDQYVKIAYINSRLLWWVFEKKYKLTYNETSELFKNLLATHLELEHSRVFNCNYI